MNRSLLFLSLLMVSAPAYQAELGRLFYTAEQRQRMESERLQQRPDIASAKATASKPLTYDGVVLRSDGRSTRWINGKPQAGGGYSITANGKTLRPGQTIAGNQVYEAHGIRREEKGREP